MSREFDDLKREVEELKAFRDLLRAGYWPAQDMIFAIGDRHRIYFTEPQHDPEAAGDLTAEQVARSETLLTAPRIEWDPANAYGGRIVILDGPEGSVSESEWLGAGSLALTDISATVKLVTNADATQTIPIVGADALLLRRGLPLTFTDDFTLDSTGTLITLTIDPGPGDLILALARRYYP